MARIFSYIEAPNNREVGEFYISESVFLAGGITGCPDWQSEIRPMLEGALTVINPRRANFPIDDPSAATEQISWEHRMLRQADKILFWFPAATLCPIVLYELGAWSMTDKPIAIGIEEGYQRTDDVVIQTQLVRPDVPIVGTLEDLAEAILNA